MITKKKLCTHKRLKSDHIKKSAHTQKFKKCLQNIKKSVHKQKFKKCLQKWKNVCTHKSLKSGYEILKSDYKKLKSGYKNLKSDFNIFCNTVCGNGAPY